ncbi:MAG: (Fe-S)-binding protein [Candidatus Helarchaeota archaeon]
MYKNEDFIKELLKCVRCGKCRAVCPEINLEEFQEESSPRGRIRMAYGLITKKIPPTQILIDKIYSCFYCGICQITCPSGVMTSDLILKTREYLYDLGLSPNKVNNLLETIIKTKNIYGLDQEDRLDWAFDVEDIIENKINKKADIGLFIGCTASYKGSLAIQPESIVKILDHLNIDFTLLGEKEMCCGNPYFLGGGAINDKIREIVLGNIENFAKLKIKKLITACPGCYRIIKTIYPIIYGKELPFEVYHVTQYFDDLINKNVLKLKKSIDLKLTYQDPCELARHCGIFEQPRNIFEKIPGLKFFELTPNKDNAVCCGGGGLVKLTFPDIVDKQLKVKFNQISECNDKLDGIITACPSCQDNLQYGNTLLKENLKVIDICDLILRAIK